MLQIKERPLKSHFTLAGYTSWLSLTSTWGHNSIMCIYACLGLHRPPSPAWPAAGESPISRGNIIRGTRWNCAPQVAQWVKRIRLQCRRHRKHEFNPWVGKIPWKRACQPTPVFLPTESHGQRSLVGYSPWGRKELDMTEATEHTPDGVSPLEGLYTWRMPGSIQKPHWWAHLRRKSVSLSSFLLSWRGRSWDCLLGFIVKSVLVILHPSLPPGLEEADPGRLHSPSHLAVWLLTMHQQDVRGWEERDQVFLPCPHISTEVSQWLCFFNFTKRQLLESLLKILLTTPKINYRAMKSESPGLGPRC